MEIAFAIWALPINVKLIEIEGLVPHFGHEDSLAQTLVERLERIDEDMLQVVLVNDLNELIHQKFHFAFFGIIQFLRRKDELFPL